MVCPPEVPVAPGPHGSAHGPRWGSVAEPRPLVDGAPTGRVADDREGGDRLSTDPGLVPWWDPGADRTVSPETDGVVVAGVTVAKGSRVCLRPGQRRADAQDMFLAGREATVEAVFLDVDGNRHLAVTLDEDPAADLQRWHGRYLYFSPDEVEPR